MEQEASLTAALTGTLIFLSNSGVPLNQSEISKCCVDQSEESIYLISLISARVFRGSSNFAGHITLALELTLKFLGTKHNLDNDLRDNISENF